MFQAKITSIAQKAQKIPGVLPASYQKDFPDTRINERVNRVVHHRFVINGE
jgi:hypothetical protein